MKQRDIRDFANSTGQEEGGRTNQATKNQKGLRRSTTTSSDNIMSSLPGALSVVTVMPNCRTTEDVRKNCTNGKGLRRGSNEFTSKFQTASRSCRGISILRGLAKNRAIRGSICQEFQQMGEKPNQNTGGVNTGSIDGQAGTTSSEPSQNDQVQGSLNSDEEHGISLDPIDATDSQFLSEAFLVTEDERREPQHIAQVVDPEELERHATRSQKDRQWRRIGHTLALISVSILAFALGIYLSNRDTEASAGGDKIPTLAPTSKITAKEKMLSLLPDFSLEALRKTTSPQNEALEWILADPNLFGYSDKRLVQRFALATIFRATGGGTSWFQNSHWLKYNIHECQWWSSGVNSLDTEFQWLPMKPSNDTTPCHLEEYVMLDLYDNGLTGTLPKEFYLLTSLKNVNLGINPELSGSISPEAISNLPNMNYINVFATNFAGSIPTEVALFSNLIGLSLEGTQFEGTIPTEVGLLTDLHIARFGRSSLSGVIPSELGQLTNLFMLSFESTKLEGPIPLELFNLTLLHYLDGWHLSNGGRLPTELGQLSNLVLLDLGDSSMTGPIPSEIGQLSKLEHMSLKGNLLSSKLPSTIGKLSSLFRIILHDNMLSGAIPTEMGLIPLTGNMSLDSYTSEQVGAARSMGSVARMFLVSNNQLTGSIPRELSQMKDCEMLMLSGNSLQQSIPTDLGHLTSLQRLAAANNLLTGSIPSELGLAVNMTFLHLANNFLTPSIPAEIPQQWHQLEYFNVSNNSMTGPIGDELVAWSFTLRQLDISGNDFSGSIPEQACDKLLELAFDCSNTLCGCDCDCAEGPKPPR